MYKYIKNIYNNWIYKLYRSFYVLTRWAWPCHDADVDWVVWRHFVVSHVYREFNADADSFANIALDRSTRSNTVVINDSWYDRNTQRIMHWPCLVVSCSVSVHILFHVLWIHPVFIKWACVPPSVDTNVVIHYWCFSRGCNFMHTQGGILHRPIVCVITAFCWL